MSNEMRISAIADKTSQSKRSPVSLAQNQPMKKLIRPPVDEILRNILLCGLSTVITVATCFCIEFRDDEASSIAQYEYSRTPPISLPTGVIRLSPLVHMRIGFKPITLHIRAKSRVGCLIRTVNLDL